MALPEPSESSTALITGASAGIGAEIAKQLAERGHGVTLVARRKDRIDSLATDLVHRYGIRAEAIACDLSDAGERERLAEAVAGLDLDVAILVNNAGFGAFGDFAESERERQIEMVRLNVEAIVDLTARYLPAMVSRGDGAVVNIASTASFQPLPGSATYAATKAFVLSHTEAIHEELRGTGVTIGAVCPGPVRTEFTEAAGAKHLEAAGPGIAWLEASDVARQAIEAAAKGKRVTVPGMLNQAGALAGRHTPRNVLMPVVRQVWRRTVTK